MAATTESRDWVPDDAALAMRLAKVRNRMGWNAKEAATECGLPPQSWRNWEAGTQPQDVVGVCRRISDRTGVSLQWLVFGYVEGELSSYLTAA
jgi:transcriptional regulator with XRE-family HTH domain